MKEIDIKVSAFGIILECHWCGDKMTQAEAIRCPECKKVSCEHCLKGHSEKCQGIVTKR